MLLVQNGFGIKGVDLGWSPIHVEKNNVANFRREMGRLCRENLAEGSIIQQTQQSERAKAIGATTKHFPPGHGLAAKPPTMMIRVQTDLLEVTKFFKIK